MNKEHNPNITILPPNAEAEDVTPEVNVISEMRTFADDEGRTVMGTFPIEDPTNPSFIGIFTVGSSVGPMRMQIEFPQGLTIAECFEQFDALAKETIEKAQAEANDQGRIVTPDQMRGQGQGIVIP